MINVTAIGEVLIDFTPSGENSDGNLLFARNPGGAPANVLAANTKLGGKTAFIGKVGKDDFGNFLKSTLDNAGISTEGLVFSEDVPTTLAFVQLTEKGDRSFSFYRKPGADVTLTADEIKKDLIDQCHILHFGSVSLTDEPSRGATMEAVKYAKSKGKIISYDPNYRPLLWNNKETAKTVMLEALKYADILKVSEEEMVLLTGEENLEKGSKELAKSGVSLVLVSLGADGAFYRKGDICGVLPTYDVKTIDTTGAGDAFFGSIHYRLNGKSLAEIQALTIEELEDIVAFGNAAGSLTTMKIGAIPALPTFEEIKKCQKEVKLIG